MRYSYLINETDYKKYDDPKNRTAGNDDFLGPEENGNYYKCCMPSDEMDRCLADHTNKDGSIDYDGLNEHLGLHPGQINGDSHRVDFEANPEQVDMTRKDGVNNNGKCEGDGELPGGYPDLEAKNVPRKNANGEDNVTDRGRLDGSEPMEQHSGDNSKSIEAEKDSNPVKPTEGQGDDIGSTTTPTEASKPAQSQGNEIGDTVPRNSTSGQVNESASHEPSNTPEIGVDM